MYDERGNACDTDSKHIARKDIVREAIVKCFAILTEKREEIRSDFVNNGAALARLVEIVGKDAKISSL